MIEELEVGGGDLSVPPTLSSEREASFDYPTCSWTNSNGDTLEVIYIGVMEERHLVLMPGVAWHRKPAQRKFTEVLSKPTTVQLPCAAVNNREEMLEDTMKGWLGYVTDEVAAELEPVDGVDAREAINFRFGLGEDAGYVTALAELAMKHYGFVSAESAVDGEGTGAQRPPVQGRDAGSAPAGAMVASEVGLQERVGNLEKTMTDMAANLQLVLNHLSPPAEPPTVERRVTIDPKPKRISASGAALSSGSGATAKSSSRPSALRKSPSTSFPSLDPGVVAAATAAGIPQETLQEMEKLMGVDLAGAKRLKEASMSKIKAAPPRKGVAGVLSESEDEETEAEGSGVDSSGNPMEASLQKLTEIVGILAMDKKKKAKASKMEQALDGISAGSGSDASLAGGVKRAAAARRVLRQALVDHPAEVSGMLERLLMEDLTSQVQGPGMPEASFCARAWLEHRNRIGAYRTSAHCAWSIAGVWDDLYYGRIAHARARAGLLLLMLDHTAIDKGQWHFSSELSIWSRGRHLLRWGLTFPPRFPRGKALFHAFWIRDGQRSVWRTCATPKISSQRGVGWARGSTTPKRTRRSRRPKPRQRASLRRVREMHDRQCC